ncbi:preprotein translocase subunit SecG [Novosphingobium capsulatum]|uniref:Protein-export membrane protein SecG n=1 Tax=Novosphingobium capsulatum TaxID=13688 RepID=A0ABU1MGZ9_9SPHN|nr:MULTISPECIES: preprotein translocase subunit SecG [Novosphingobium]KPF55413.1 preprotein translocase subunit SecG [Novosphingobium sp. AAP1]MBB3358371.1 preprotein translocase subunit SecG [Novosphingobium sp. BK256]MBB3374732.1 preprotein translocase subunit SecG [Novosphingobium sp. BK280]MBB3379579.1 preprotein translocase subunit SecG [Novosphingobium sp. BK258]MBB3421274.1 preprotein translocase subunit SecG [Novosphingobium sp. BK267]
MSLFIFLTVIQALVAAALVGVILIQKSEGGGLGVGGSPAGFMSARGAADFLTRVTSILAVLFVGLSIVLAAMAVNAGGSRTLDTSLQRTADPLAGQAQQPVAPAAPAADPSAAAPAAPADPLGGAAKQ